MSRKLALILACSVLVSLFSSDVQALPALSVPAQTAAPEITLVRGFCGLGFHRGPYGYCVRNGTVYVPPVVVAPSAPVVVAPSAPVVVAPSTPVVVAPSALAVVPPIVCPYGYYLGPYGHCLPY
jgi:hypothetical protein